MFIEIEVFSAALLSLVRACFQALGIIVYSAAVNVIFVERTKIEETKLYTFLGRHFINLHGMY